MSNEITPFESIRRTNLAGNEFWSSRDFAKVLGYRMHRILPFRSIGDHFRRTRFGKQ